MRYSISLWRLAPIFIAWALAAQDFAVIKDAIAELNNSFPPPVSPAASPDSLGCNRSHQGLYNELVTCVQEVDDAVKITYSNIKYNNDPTSNTFWVNKKHIIGSSY